MNRFLILTTLALAGCTTPAADPWGEASLRRMTPRTKAAQLLVVPLGRAVPAEAGGVQLVAMPAAVARTQVDSLQRAAALPLMVVAELHGGMGGVLRGATRLPPAPMLRTLADAEEAAEVTALEAQAAGVNLARLPGPGASPLAAGDGFARFASELEARGIPALIDAFGPAERVPLAWDRAALDGGAIRALRRADHAAGIELAWSAIPSLTGDTVPLPIAPAATTGLIRRDLAFAGVLVADLDSAGEWRARFGARAPIEAVAAGADLLLGVADAAAARDSLVAAVGDGRIPPQRLNAAVGRVFALKARLRLAPPPDTALAPAPIPAPAGAELTARLYRTSIRRRGDPSRVMRGCRSLLSVSRPGQSAPHLVAALRRRRPGLTVTEADSVPARGPGCLLLIAGRGGPPVVVENPARDSLLPLRPRVVTTLGGGDPGAAVWLAVADAGEAAQRAAADALVGAGPVAVSVPDWTPALTRAAPESAGMSGDSLALIDRVMRAALDSVFTGAAIAIGRHGRLVKLTGYGRTAGLPVSPDSTLFDLASLTKVVGTTSAAMLLVDDGDLSTSDPLRRHLSGFRGGGRGDVTVRHLLTHTAGLPPGADLYGGTQSAAEAAARVQRAELLTGPGERLVYSDFGMILLARGIEATAEEPLDQLLARRVFAPLGMVETRYRPAAQLQDRTVPTALRSERPYVLDAVVHDGNAFRLGGVAGHAGLFSTADEVAVFAQAILNRGSYAGQRVWSAQTVRAFTTPQALPGRRALGWDVPGPRSAAGDYFSARSVGHTGYTGTSLWIDPERELFVVLLTNRTFDRGSQGQIYGIRRRVHDLAARAITDQRILPRPGTPAAQAAERARVRRSPPRRPTTPRPRRPRRG